MNSRHYRDRQRGDFSHNLLALARQRLRLFRALAAGNHVDIRAGDKVVGLRGNKHQALQRVVIPHLFDNGVNLRAERGLQGVHLFARHVNGDHRDVVRPDMQ